MQDSMDRKDQSTIGQRLIIKAQVGDDIRRVAIHNTALTYDELVLMLTRVFSKYITTGDEVIIKYKDEDGDLITMFDTTDLELAIMSNNSLKLQVNVKKHLQPIPNNEEIVEKFKSDLNDINEKIKHLLNIVNDFNSLKPYTMKVAAVKSTSTNSTDALNPREFDPLQESARDIPEPPVDKETFKEKGGKPIQTAQPEASPHTNNSSFQTAYTVYSQSSEHYNPHIYTGVISDASEKTQMAYQYNSSTENRIGIATNSTVPGSVMTSTPYVVGSSVCPDYYQQIQQYNQSYPSPAHIK